ncbi:hypothetical protein BC830DRAFT_1174695 [Chytriomyces sp. MP71]|nr:hypothetical protein BC830DRAFT_1174695 [Chytriomyces sp. MP71]
MGASLCTMAGDSGDVSGRPAPVPPEVMVDLKDPTPTAEEAQLLEQVIRVLQVSAECEPRLRGYTGCGEVIRMAISKPSQETEQAAWDQLGPAIQQLKFFYDHSLQLGEAFPRLLQYLGTGDIQRNLETSPATAKRMADVLVFASNFDELKMMNSNLQNDFSYYRRSLQKVRMAGGSKSSASGANMLVDDMTANNMSMFYAQSSPMTRVLIDCCVYLPGRKALTNDNIMETLAILSYVCYNSVHKNLVQGNMVDYCLRVLVMCIVICDHISPGGGVFARGSRMNIRLYVKLIQTYGGAQVNTLMNSVRYSTLHLNSETTPESLRALCIKL